MGSILTWSGGGTSGNELLAGRVRGLECLRDDLKTSSTIRKKYTDTWTRCIISQGYERKESMVEVLQGRTNDSTELMPSLS